MEKLKTINNTEQKRPVAVAHSNPMKDSQYCYYQSFGRVLMGFAKVLELKNGQIQSVSASEILEQSNIDPEEFYNVFKGPQTILHDIYQEIHTIFENIESLSIDMNSRTQFIVLFQRLKKNSPMLRVLSLIHDHSIWRKNLRQLVLGRAIDWPPVASSGWDYLYENFCCQFANILEKWETTDYAEVRIDDCVRLVEIWLSVDSMIGDTAGDVLDDWSLS